MVLPIAPNPSRADPLRRLSRKLATHYRLEGEIGRGGMAVVYLARELKHDRAVALKVMNPQLTAVLGPEQFLHEVRLTAQLDHPHILAVHDSGKGAGLLWYTMPFVEGGTLRGRLEREVQLPLADALRIAAEVADALDYAHERGIVHRDVKPENILLARGHARLADFGLARTETGDSRSTAVGLAVGTPVYMSPEQASGGVVDGRSDIYALGCVLYEMLAGEPPYLGATAQAMLARRLLGPPAPLSALRSGVPAPVERAVSRALASAGSERFQTAAEFRDALCGSPAGTRIIAPAARLTAAGAGRRSWQGTAAALLASVARALRSRGRGQGVEEAA